MTEDTNTPKAFTDSEGKLLPSVFQCMKEQPEVILEKLIGPNGYKNKASANTAWHKLRKKIGQSTSFTVAEQKLLSMIFQCMTKPPEIDVPKLVTLSNYTTKASANTAWHKLRKKIALLQTNTEIVAGGNSGGDEDDEAGETDTIGVYPAKKAVGTKKAVNSKASKTAIEPHEEEGSDVDCGDNIIVANTPKKMTPKSTKGKGKPAKQAASEDDNEEPKTLVPTPKSASKKTPAKSASAKPAVKKRARGKASKVDPEDEPSDDDTATAEPTKKKTKVKPVIDKDAAANTSPETSKDIVVEQEATDDGNMDTNVTKESLFGGDGAVAGESGTTAADTDAVAVDQGNAVQEAVAADPSDGTAAGPDAHAVDRRTLAEPSTNDATMSAKVAGDEATDVVALLESTASTNEAKEDVVVEDKGNVTVEGEVQIQAWVAA